MSEKLALEKCFGQGSGIDAYHRLQCPHGHPVNLSCKDILSRAVLSGYKYSRIGRGDLVYGPAYYAHRRTLAPKHRGRRCRLRICLLRLLAAVGIRSLQDLDELVILPRLYDEVERAALHAFHCQLDVCVCSKEHHLDVRAALLYLREPVQPFVSCIYVCVEIHVKQHDIRTEIRKSAYQFLRRGDSIHLGKMHGQKQLQRSPDAIVVVHNQYLSLILCHNR